MKTIRNAALETERKMENARGKVPTEQEGLIREMEVMCRGLFSAFEVIEERLEKLETITRQLSLQMSSIR